MESRLRRAAETGVRTLVVRAGDYFGPRARNNWFSQGLIAPGRPVATVRYPGRRGIGHQWAYLPDVAETMVRLVEQADALGPFETFHMGGHWDPDGGAMTAAIGRVVGRPNLPVRTFPWPVVTLASPFVTLFREMQEMRYLWREPVRLDNSRLVAVLGSEPHTPLDTAIRTTLIGLGCLDSQSAPITA
jgi:nucleoside-diphosphate-sugar epimerase